DVTVRVLDLHGPGDGLREPCPQVQPVQVAVEVGRDDVWPIHGPQLRPGAVARLETARVHPAARLAIQRLDLEDGIGHTVIRGDDVGDSDRLAGVQRAGRLAERLAPEEGHRGATD